MKGNLHKVYKFATIITEEDIKRGTDFINESISDREFLTIDEAESLWIQGVNKIFKVTPQ